MTNSAITPSPELVTSLRNSAPHGIRDAGVTRELWLINQAYQAGADQELEACVNWLDDTDCEDPQEVAQRLRATRRPKPPTPKLQALKAISHLLDGAGRSADNANAAATIRRALEALDD